MKIKKPLLLIFSVLICELAGILGTFAVMDSLSTWYTDLTKPVFNPPGFVFGPVWTILYALMGIALYLIWREGLKKRNVAFAVKIFFIHLIVNASWSIIFFGAKQILLSLIVIVVLLIMIAWLVNLFAKINKTASLLLMPYLAWVSFATILNFSIWILNR